VVIMITDASPGVIVEAAAGARTELVVPVSFFLLLGGVRFAEVAAVMLVVAVRGPAGSAAVATAAVAGGFGHYPVRLEGELDPNPGPLAWLPTPP
jgi:hypothetical protein